MILLESLTDPREAEFLKDRLFREARSAGQLFHPCIVVVLDVGYEGDTAFIAMERVEGQTLQQMISAGSVHRRKRRSAFCIRPPRRSITRISTAWCIAILSPPTSWCRPECMVKVADFGIAKIMSAQNATQSGIVMGTPTYMSPEQIEGLPVDGRSDQFALTVLAYELLTGVRPFQGDSLASLAHSIVYAERPLATSVNPALPASINAILGRGFARSAADRYASCGEMVRAIESALDNVPVPAAILAPPPAPVATIAPAAPPVVVPVTEVATAPPPKKGNGMIWLFAIAVVVLIVIAAAYVIYRPGGSAPVPKPAAVSIVVQHFVAEPTSIEAGSASKLTWAVTGRNRSPSITASETSRPADRSPSRRPNRPPIF